MMMSKMRQGPIRQIGHFPAQIFAIQWKRDVQRTKTTSAAFFLFSLAPLRPIRRLG